MNTIQTVYHTTDTHKDLFTARPGLFTDHELKRKTTQWECPNTGTIQPVLECYNATD